MRLSCLPSLVASSGHPSGEEPRLSNIRNRFGDRVADIVRSGSDSVVNTSDRRHRLDEDVRFRKPQRNKKKQQ
jgi:hypothetical protein